MRITKTATHSALQQTAKEIANLGCNICPCCGETKTMMEYFNEGVLNRGVFGGLVCKTWAQGLFHTKHMQVDCYSCETCGAQWESEPYERE